MSSWATILEDQKISPLSHNDAESSELVLCPLEYKSCLSVTGPEAKTFLQGQLSCDTRELSAGQWRHGAHCSHKGRMLSSFRAWAPTEEQVCLLMRKDNAEFARAALAKYIVFSKAEIQIEPNLLGLGLSGTNARTTIEALNLPVHSQDKANQLTEALGDQKMGALNIGEDRFEIWAPAPAMADLLNALKPNAIVANNNYWKLLDIHAGVGEVQTGSEELFIPQMLNFNEIGGINYQKGCYTGQEIVARMEYRGNVKRKMIRLHSDDVFAAPAAGSELYCTEKKQSIGNIVDAVSSDRGVDALAVCAELDATELVTTDHENGNSFHAFSLTYAITN